MKTLLPLLLAAVLFSGCKPVLKKVYGLKDPALENDRSIKEYLVQREVDTSRVVTFPTVFSFAMASEQNYLTFPDAIFFNKEGYHVPYKASAQTCNANVPKFIGDLQNFSGYEVDKSKTLDQLKSLIGMPADSIQPDVTVFITWTKYSGRLNETKAFEWIKLLDKAKSDGLSVDYYLLNCDFHEKWNLTEEQVKAFKVY